MFIWETSTDLIYKSKDMIPVEEPLRSIYTKAEQAHILTICSSFDLLSFAVAR